MTAIRWLRGGGSSRGAPSGRSAALTKRLVLVCVAVAGLASGGCQSLGLGNGLGNGCGMCGGLRLPRLFHRNNDCCAPGMGVPAVEAAPLPGAIVAPGVVPAAPPAAVEELAPVGPPASSSAPSAEPGTRSQGNGNGSTTGSKTNYEANRPAYRSAPRGANLARALAPGQTTVRRAAPRRATTTPPSPNDPLDNLPPLTLPSHEGADTVTPAVAPEASSLPSPAPDEQAEAARGPAPAPAATGNRTTTDPPAKPATDAAARPSGGPSARPLSATEAISDPATKAASGPAEVAKPLETGMTVAPGLKHFQGLEPKLAGGSLPSLTGLDWLADKGYKTILDLREPGPDQPAYISEVTKRGFRYLALPISADSIDAEHVTRFNAEIDLADARPLYFFDTDGQRAGALWYIRRLTLDKVKADAKTAAQEAKDLGLSDQKYWLAATAYLDKLPPAKDPVSSVLQAAPPEEATLPSAGITALGPTRVAANAPAPAPAPVAPPAAASAAPPAPRDPSGWRPYAALLMTVMGLPLAYWGRTSLTLVTSHRASLPAPAKAPRALPDASDG